MASAGGPASIITQVQQGGGGAPLSNLASGEDRCCIAMRMYGANNKRRQRRREHHSGSQVCASAIYTAQSGELTTSNRGTRFTLSRDELLTLPEFVLLSLFPNGLLPDGHMNSYHDGDVYPVDVSTETSSNDGNVITQARQSGGTESSHGSRSTASVIKNALSNPALYLSDIYYSSQYDPNSLQYMLDFFRHVAQTIPASPPSPSTESAAHEAIPIEPMQGSARDMLQDRAGIIVLREDLDFYAIPPRKDIEQAEMMEVKRAAGKALLKQDGIFSGLRKSEEPGTTEQHLIEMLTAGYVYPDFITQLNMQPC